MAHTSLWSITVTLLLLVASGVSRKEGKIQLINEETKEETTLSRKEFFAFLKKEGLVYTPHTGIIHPMETTTDVEIVDIISGQKCDTVASTRRILNDLGKSLGSTQDALKELEDIALKVVDEEVERVVNLAREQLDIFPVLSVESTGRKEETAYARKTQLGRDVTRLIANKPKGSITYLTLTEAASVLDRPHLALILNDLNKQEKLLRASTKVEDLEEQLRHEGVIPPGEGDTADSKQGGGGSKGGGNEQESGLAGLSSSAADDAPSSSSAWSPGGSKKYTTWKKVQQRAKKQGRKMSDVEKAEYVKSAFVLNIFPTLDYKVDTYGATSACLDGIGSGKSEEGCDLSSKLGGLGGGRRGEKERKVGADKENDTILKGESLMAYFEEEKAKAVQAAITSVEDLFEQQVLAVIENVDSINQLLGVQHKLRTKWRVK